MSSNIKSSTLLIAIVGLAVASYASLVTGSKLPKSLSELAAPGGEELAKYLKDRFWSSYELLEKLDTIYESLDDETKMSGNEQKIAEQFEIHHTNPEQFCTEYNMRAVSQLVFNELQLYDIRYPSPDDRQRMLKYLSERNKNLLFLCKSYVLKDMNDKVGNFDKSYKLDMISLGDNLLPIGTVEKFYHGDLSTKWMDIVLTAMKKMSGDNWDPNSYIADREGFGKFQELWSDGVVRKCTSWQDVTSKANFFQNYELTREQARWIDYSHVCYDILKPKQRLADRLYAKLKDELKVKPKSKPKSKSSFFPKWSDLNFQGFERVWFGSAVRNKPTSVAILFNITHE